MGYESEWEMQQKFYEKLENYIERFITEFLDLSYSVTYFDYTYSVVRHLENS